LRVFNKKIIIIVFLVLIFFAGIIALTQENDDMLPDIDSEEIESLLDIDFNPEMDEWIRPARWFRSNKGGMALEEMQSRFAALRGEYALAINYVSNEEIPEYLSFYYDENYYVEVRILYNKGEQIRTQWIFRDEKLNTRLNAVFIEPELETESEEESGNNEEIAQIIAEEETENLEQAAVAAPVAEEEAAIAGVAAVAEEEAAAVASAVAAVAETEEEEQENEYEDEKIVIIKDIKSRKGFIEIFDENLFLTSEYMFFEDGRTTKTEYELKDNLLVNAVYSISDNNDNYKTTYTDYYRYNRSLSLRNIERIFHNDEILEDPVTIAFPRHIMEAVKTGIIANEKLNLYPDFFGDIFVGIGSKMIFDIDNRGRILGQTLYDDADKLLWVIKNTWKDNRIVMTTKTEGETILSAEYAYNSGGDRINEKNLKNGVLERIVYTEGDTEIEELYMNNAVVLRAVWEDGRKISEIRVRN
jgi:hypothetical protein